MNSIIKKLAVLAIFATFFAAQKTYTTQEDWFQTWDRPEYVEWAAEIPEGYELHIISAQESDYLVVKANLLMGSNGLPGFEVIEQVYAKHQLKM